MLRTWQLKALTYKPLEFHLLASELSPCATVVSDTTAPTANAAETPRLLPEEIALHFSLAHDKLRSMRSFLSKCIHTQFIFLLPRQDDN